MRRMILAGLILAPAFVLASASTAVDGTWHIDGSVAGTAVMSTCILTETDGTLKGTCTGTDGKPMPITGTVKNTAIVWQYDSVYQGGAITLTYTGSLDKDKHITGAIDVQPYAVTGDFTATRD